MIPPRYGVIWSSAKLPKLSQGVGPAYADLDRSKKFTFIKSISGRDPVRSHKLIRVGAG